MPINVTRPYRLDDYQRKALVEYLQGKRTQKSTAMLFGVKRQNLLNITHSIFRDLASTKKVNISKLLKDY